MNIRSWRAGPVGRAGLGGFEGDCGVGRCNPHTRVLGDGVLNQYPDRLQRGALHAVLSSQAPGLCPPGAGG